MSSRSGDGVSVVVASNRSRSLLEACLRSLAPEARELEAEIVVARDGSPADLEKLEERFPDVRFVEADAGATIPHLRGRGMAAARGSYLALTEDHCMAEPGWLGSLLSGFDGRADVVGGGMGNARVDRMVDWAAYFSEYGFFSSTRPPAGGEPPLTGANVAYGPTVVDPVTQWAEEGEWENTIHGRLRDAGRAFAFVPTARILQNRRYDFLGFCRDRFQHGVDYARTRLREEPGTGRWPRLLSAPLLPVVLLNRVRRASGRESPGAFWKAAPVTLCFLVAWSVGEAVGYLEGPAR